MTTGPTIEGNQPRRGRAATTAVVVITLMVVCVGALAAQSSLGWALTAAIAVACAPLVLVSLLALSLEVLMVALVVACQVTTLRFGIGGRSLFLEHLAVLAVLGALSVRLPGIVIRRPHRHEALLLAWILWNGAVSLVFAPSPADSMAIVVWMGLAWLILWCCSGYFHLDPESARRIMRIGAGVAAALGALSFLLWILALSGISTLGVQPEFVTGTLAAKGVALEANLLGSQSLCWLFWLVRERVVDDVPLPSWRVLGVTLGIVASMTRAVWLAVIVIGGAAAAVRFISARTQARRPMRFRALVTTIAGLAALVLVTVLGAPPAQKLGAVLDFRSSTGEARVRNWNVAWGEVTDSGAYLLGSGTNSYTQRHLSRTVRGQPDYLGNLGLTILYDSGLFGVTLFLTALTSVVFRPTRAGPRIMNGGFVVALLVVGAATNPIWFGFPWIVIAALDARHKKTPDRDADGAGDGSESSAALA